MKQNLTAIKGLIVVTAIALLTACNAKYEKTASGLVYKIDRGSGKDTLKNGNWIQFNIEYKLAKKDSVLFSTFKKAPQFIEIDYSKITKHDITEILNKLHFGDKAEFIMNVDTLVKMKQMSYNQLFTKGETIKGKIDIIKVYANADAAKADKEVAMKKAQEIQMKEMEAQRKTMKEKAAKDLADYLSKNKAMVDKQIASLKDYATKNSIKYTQTALGTLVEITTQGTGAKPTDGKFAQVMYRGYLENGKVFDANLGADAKHKDPLPIAFGEGGTIPGFEDGLKLFSKGAKGRILIPAALAYREQENGEIKPNSNLIFDIEMLDVTDVPAAINQTPSTQPKEEANHDDHKH
jgi:FKBP-type peptidyl-prolyl cis-trans isomerase FkpA